MQESSLQLSYILLVYPLSPLHFIQGLGWHGKITSFLLHYIVPHNCKDPKSINFPPPLLCLDYNTTAHLLAYKVCSVIFFASLLLYQDGLITLPNNKSFQHHFYLSIKANDATITGFICHIKISMKEIKVRVLPPLTEFSVAWICLVSSERTYLYVPIYRNFFLILTCIKQILFSVVFLLPL